ncbi:MAG: hypothetical protein NVSMB56_17900 [Pyrinomonadaceae bacterium]
MLGYSVEDWLSTPNFWLSIVHDEDKVRAAHEAAAIFASGKVGTSTFRWVAKDGRVLWVEAQSSAISDESGHPVGMRGVTMDITERIVAEESRLQLSAIVDSSDDAIIGKTLDGVITSWNRAAERMYGYAAEEVIGQPITIIVSPERRHETAQILEQIGQGVHIAHSETVRVTKTGKPIHVSLSRYACSPVKPSNGVCDVMKFCSSPEKKHRGYSSLRKVQCARFERGRMDASKSFMSNAP